MEFKPLGNRVLVQKFERKDTTEGGIFIPESAEGNVVEGRVVAVGKGKVDLDGNTLPMEVKPGDHVAFSKLEGSELEVGNSKYLIMEEEDVLGIMK